MATKDPWVISAVEQFAKDFPVGSRLTAQELGKWMVNMKAIDPPKSTQPKDPTWIKYVRERNVVRTQLNRYASSKAFFESSVEPPFEIQYAGRNKYLVCAINDDIRKLMRDLLERTQSGFGIKVKKIDRLHDIAEQQALPYPEVLRLERMREDLTDTNDDLSRILNKAIRLLDRCEKDIQLLEEHGVVNGDGDDDE